MANRFFQIQYQNHPAILGKERKKLKIKIFF